MFDALRDAGFDVLTKNHAEAILSVDFPTETAELIGALMRVSIPAAELIASGGGEAKSTQRMRRELSAAGWAKHNFRIETTVDGVPVGDGTSHEIDHIRRGPKGLLALEIEWNNKDPFFDRDLENFQRLHAQSIISVGIIVTRGAALQAAMAGTVESFLRRAGLTSEEGLLAYGMKERTARQRNFVAKAQAQGDDFATAFARFFVMDKYGPSSTHWSKLEARVARGVGNPCPLLLIGLPEGTVRDAGEAPEEEPRLF
ncbi:BglII/BstYI family type II restriction endonuclease [Pseudooceanicola nanhaiensis]|uniref:BglII/BstYI family type II restriction endonuclease n=1 Tax=Pseudooceanicola nanhaiensis TaxID=375761 RepID=UPI001CD57612|nr:BglII/BstYI family type II restriction endonuclease [Pseudooceanicola nanhaiensis]MCA0922398.1 restriction endonuclease [Pseudooceanicola nanhaiensis]